jgi:uncharacterized membrane protein
MSIRDNALTGNGEEYPWNIRINVGGISFTGPGAESRSDARALEKIVQDKDDVQNVEVFKQ